MPGGAALRVAAVHPAVPGQGGRGQVRGRRDEGPGTEGAGGQGHRAPLLPRHQDRAAQGRGLGFQTGRLGPAHPKPCEWRPRRWTRARGSGSRWTWCASASTRSSTSSSAASASSAAASTCVLWPPRPPPPPPPARALESGTIALRGGGGGRMGVGAGAWSLSATQGASPTALTPARCPGPSSRGAPGARPCRGPHGSGGPWEGAPAKRPPWSVRSAAERPGAFPSRAGRALGRVEPTAPPED